MLNPSIRYPLIQQLTRPAGYWLSAGTLDFCKRFSEMRSAAPCGPSDKNGAVPAVTAPTVPGPGVRILRPLQQFRADLDRDVDRIIAESEAKRLARCASGVAS